MMTGKNKRMISVLGYDNSFTGVLASYFHLLKPQLKDNWVLNRIDKHSEVVVIPAGYGGSISKKSKITIILGMPKDLNKFESDQDLDQIFNIKYPISSAKIINVLNKISEIKGLDENNESIDNKVAFSFKNVFSKFMHIDFSKDNITTTKSHTSKLEKKIAK
ncbi:MAG: hypothetical protein JKY19_02325 [Alcanivoracaceae bacterium]|nr:hypothetical protein [Alcanivoracaceae bacterium]